jgi:CHAD domain-containing protein
MSPRPREQNGQGTHAADRSSRREFSRRVEADLAERECLFVAAARQVEDGDDPEAIHDLRVASRQLTEALRLWSGVLDAKHAKRVERLLRRLRRKAGPVRELEATRELILEYYRPLPSEAQAAVRPFLRRLDRRIKKGRRRMAAWTTRTLVGRVLEASACARLSLRSRGDGRPDPLEEARRRLTRRHLTLARRLAKLETSTEEAAFHAARIAVKKARYAEESWVEVEGARDAARVARLRALQQALGSLRDHDVLAAALETQALELAARDRLSRARALGPIRESVRQGRAKQLAAFRRLAASDHRSSARSARELSASETEGAFAGGRPRLQAVHPRGRRHGS